jgi:hypothetical protein
MKEALELHPEWNGDWAMPANVRKAEIDIRSGLLIRELDALAPTEAKATPTPSPTPAVEGLDDPAWATENLPESKENFNTNIPPEFRRVELFIGGTIPPREMIDTGEPVYDESAPYQSSESPPTTAPTPTPLTNTWENQVDRGGDSNSSRRSSSGAERGVSVTVCPVTGMRVTSNCPYSESRTFKPGTEPRDFCTLHR